jgi:hypothetical protein
MDKGNPIYKPLLESGGILIDLLVIKCSITIKAVHHDYIIACAYYALAIFQTDQL